jgi:hypothetical protein
MRWRIALLGLLLFSSPAAADWEPNNRIKPGESRIYEWQPVVDPSMLDARACATTIWSFEKDTISGSGLARANLYTCPRIDSVVSNLECKVVQRFKDDEFDLAANHKPGFFFLDVRGQSIPPAIAQVSVYCSDKYVAKANYIRKDVLLDTRAIHPTGIVDVPFNTSPYTKGYFVFHTSDPVGSIFLTLTILSADDGNILCVHPTSIGGNDDYVMALGGDEFELAGGGGVDLVCNVPLPGTVIFRYVSFTAGAEADLDVTFYGIPD